jgi:hypothetical protein
MLTRRDALALPAAFALPPRKNVAAIITEYRRNSHADVIVTRMLEGYEYNGKRQAPRVRVASMYTDQVPGNDLSRGFASKHNVRVFPTVREALLLGRSSLAVEGVVLIGEHGNYPDNEKGQKLYPRFELFKQIVETFREIGKAVPVFCDKHLSTDWDKAKWMYDQSRALKFPFLAGSSLPVSWRRPPFEPPLDAPIEKAVVCFYGPKEAYGFHALESLQCMVERRRGGETGVASVECLEGGAVWEWTGKNAWGARLLEAALARVEDRKPGLPRDNAKDPILFLLRYRDSLEAAVYLLNGHISQTGVALQAGQNEPDATEIWLQPGRPFSHFSSLTHWIEELIVTASAPYPVERTLLTTGALAALMDSSFHKGKRLETPHLAVRYRAPTQSFYSRGPVPALEDPPR